ncbi:MAG: putative Ig domain-containing protein [Myxococcota bacterium]
MLRLLLCFLLLSAACGDDATPADTGTDAADDGVDAAMPDAMADEGMEDAPLEMGRTSCGDDNGGCDPRVACVDTSGEVVCGRCPPGFSGRGSEACVDINECESANGGCDPLVSCTNTEGSRTCAACPSGYRDVNGNGTLCSDIDECATDNGGCGDRMCTNLPGSSMCGDCAMGFMLVDDACVDINECRMSNGGCGPNRACMNMPGSFMCGDCDSGYELREDRCVDIDECATDNGGCDELVECRNEPGGRSCGDCPMGYTGDGDDECRDINECNMSNGGCDDRCSNRPGTFECRCNGDRILASDGLRCFEPLELSTRVLRMGGVGDDYMETISASGGDDSMYSWEIVSGSLPDGLMLTGGTPGAIITGTPSADGTFNFTLRVRDADGNTAMASFSIEVAVI